MTDIQAAVGIRQLEKLNWIVEERRKIAQKYHNALKDIPFIQLPSEKEGYFSNYQSFSVYLTEKCPLERNELMQKMLDKGIATRRGIMTAHRETAYFSERKNVYLPVSEDASDRSIILPLYIPMKSEEIDQVISTFRSLLL
jgi:dTDP-4-amino-4,6-dideoxygalactose transaminase